MRASGDLSVFLIFFPSSSKKGMIVLRTQHPTKKKKNGEMYDLMMVLDAGTFYNNFGWDRFITAHWIEALGKKLVREWNEKYGPAEMQRRRVPTVYQIQVRKKKDETLCFSFYSTIYFPPLTISSS